MSAAPMLVVDGVSKKFGGVTALNDVSFALGKSELLGIVGPNGSGKTTLLSIILGLVPPLTGRVSFNGRDITNAPCYHRLRNAISATFQTPRLFDSLTVLENLELGARVKRVPGKVVAKDLVAMRGRFQLDSIFGLRADELSGGQRKIVELARAMLTNPSLLVLDEPTAGVDHALRDVISGEITRACDDGAAFVIVSHDLPWTFSLCRRVVVLDQGAVVIAGTPDEIQGDSRVLEVYL